MNMEICGFCHSFYCGKCEISGASVDALDKSCENAILRFGDDDK